MRVFNTRLNEKLSKQPNFKPQLKTQTPRGESEVAVELIENILFRNSYFHNNSKYRENRTAAAQQTARKNRTITTLRTAHLFLASRLIIFTSLMLTLSREDEESGSATASINLRSTFCSFCCCFFASTSNSGLSSASSVRRDFFGLGETLATGFSVGTTMAPPPRPGYGEW